MHTYGITDTGRKTVRFWVKDDDSLKSASKDSSIFVRLGAPALWGDNPTKDTVWVVVNNGPGYYKLHANAYDTNGTIRMYYWNDNQGWVDSSSTDSSDSYQIRLSDMNNSLGTSFTFGVRDSKTLFTQANFVVYADSAPPAPTVYAVAGTDSVTIYWKGKDMHDGNATQYKVLVNNGSATDTSQQQEILSAWKSGYSAASDLVQYDYRFKFKVVHSSNLYFYEVLTRDARGSVSASAIPTFVY
jgi:hypothetical protein